MNNKKRIIFGQTPMCTKQVNVLHKILFIGISRADLCVNSSAWQLLGADYGWFPSHQFSSDSMGKESRIVILNIFTTELLQKKQNFIKIHKVFNPIRPQSAAAPATEFKLHYATLKQPTSYSGFGLSRPTSTGWQLQDDLVCFQHVQLYIMGRWLLVDELGMGRRSRPTRVQ